LGGAFAPSSETPSCGPLPTTYDAQQKESEFKLKDRQAQFPPSQRLGPEVPIDAS
jgi:hypothetical protein